MRLKLKIPKIFYVLNSQNTNDRVRLKTKQTEFSKTEYTESLASKNDNTESFLPSKPTMSNQTIVPSHTYVWNRTHQRCPANFPSFLFGLGIIPPPVTSALLYYINIAVFFFKCLISGYFLNP